MSTEPWPQWPPIDPMALTRVQCRDERDEQHVRSFTFHTWRRAPDEHALAPSRVWQDSEDEIDEFRVAFEHRFPPEDVTGKVGQQLAARDLDEQRLSNDDQQEMLNTSDTDTVKRRPFVARASTTSDSGGIGNLRNKLKAVSSRASLANLRYRTWDRL